MDRTNPPPPNECGSGNPIFPLRGNKVETVDLGFNVGWHTLQLAYNSEANLPTTTTVTGMVASATPDAFGPLWYGSLHRKLRPEQGLLGARVSRGGGRMVSFMGSNGGIFQADARVNDRLQQSTGGYVYTDADESLVETYDTSGKLQRIDRASGQSIYFSYSTAQTPLAKAPGPDYLIAVTDSFGRVTQFNYTASSVIGSIVEPTGRQLDMAYTAGNLTSIAWQDQTVRQFTYEAPSVPWALTGVIAEGGNRKSSFGYDAAGRAVSTAYAGNTNRYSVTYGAPPSVVVTDTFDPISSVYYRVRSWQAPSAPVLTTPLGAAVSLGVGVVADNPVTLSRSQPAGSGCAASVSSQQRDVNANVTVKDDFNGNRVCYAYDMGRNLETARVEGLASGSSCTATAAGAGLPAGARKVSTEWHPDWRMPARVAEPGRLTTTVYNGRPDPFNGGMLATCAPTSSILANNKPLAVVCRRVEQATTDSDGSQGFAATLQSGVPARATSWTYNALGQKLTETDALGRTTSYAYYADSAFTGTAPNQVGHMAGDLAQVTNPAGHVMSYTLYDRLGRLMQWVDPNGVMSSHSYDARGRLTSKTTAGQTTLYAWWPTGLIQRVTTPDGSWTFYEHDGAHRLWRISDNLGNSVSYTLDAMGNRAGESVVDPNGSLRRYVARGIDALGRVEQVTGRE